MLCEEMTCSEEDVGCVLRWTFGSVSQVCFVEDGFSTFAETAQTNDTGTDTTRQTQISLGTDSRHVQSGLIRSNGADR